MGVLTHRFASLTTVSVASFFYYIFKDPQFSAQADFSPSASAVGATLAHVWPPSQQSMGLWLTLAVAFVLGVQSTFFTGGETEESKRVRTVKKRLVLAQMVQALKWEEEEEEEEEGKDKKVNEAKAGGGKEKKKKEKKRPPTTKDLFEMLYDDVEDRHVTDYGIVPSEYPYKDVLALFEERVAADLQDSVRYTRLARSALEDG